MKTATELKRFFKNYFNIPVKVRTIPCKSKWQEVRIEPEGDFRVGGNTMTFPYFFPEQFRKLCIKTVYPNSPELQTQVSAGNIGKHSISMFPHEWEKVISETESIIKA